MYRDKAVRILVADDFAHWRGQVCSLLQARPEWQIVGEACDGAEAVQMTMELLPDIVILDIGMPFLNGIEAAKFIHQRCPKSKILFVTQDGDRDLRDAATRAGGAGYVLKRNAKHELLGAIATALGNP